jgi:hypothetical protein
MISIKEKLKFDLDLLSITEVSLLYKFSSTVSLQGRPPEGNSRLHELLGGRNNVTSLVRFAKATVQILANASQALAYISRCVDFALKSANWR